MPETYRKTRTHAALIVCLIVGDAGAAIPFGLDSGPHSKVVLNVEWVFSALFALAGLCLIARLLGWLRPTKDAWPLAANTGLWSAVACYAGFFLPGATWRYRIGIGLIFLSLALINALAYARETQGEIE